MTNPEQHHERIPTHEEQEADEASPRDGPRIYVASLSDYNNGILHGRWIEAVTDPEAMQNEIDEMLRMSPTTARYGDLAEEWATHDYDGFGELRLDENEALSTIARVAGGIREHGDAFAAYASLVGTREIDGLELFEDRYQGEWDSVQAYAEHLLDELDSERVINEAPEWLQPYLKLDTEGFARDLEYSGDITTIERPDGGVWVFSA
jgi:antirestriction protein